MPVVAGDVKLRFSGGASNAVPGSSLGGVMSSVGVTPSTLENLFDNVTPAEATAGDNEYRCIYVYNSNTTDTLNAVKVWIDPNTPATGSNIQIGLDPAGIGNGSSTGVAATIANESTAPAGVTFSDVNAEGAALDVGNLGPLQGIAVWFKRIITAGAVGYSGDGCTLRAKGTPA